MRYTNAPQHDVQRRDFTINGLLLDPLPDPNTRMASCSITSEAARDLEAGIVRAIGQPERRFAEDKLRMLRAVRFAARFGYEHRPGNLRAIRRLRRAIQQVSRERVRDELTKMLTEGHARRAFELLDETGLLREVLPEIARMKGVEQPPQFHPEGDVWVHTLLLLEELPRRMLADPGLGRAAARCGQAAHLPRARPTASASTGTSRWASPWPRKSATASASPTTTREQIARAGGKPHALCRRRADEGLHL